MGVLGTGLFDDDLAADVRGEYLDLLAEGTPGVEATDALLGQHQNALANVGKGSVFWLALAATQWEAGRLEGRVRDQALAIIGNGADLVRWQHDPKLLRRRKRVLEQLQARLLGPPRPEKRVRRRFRDTCDWESGEVIGYRLPVGSLVLLRVVGLVTDSLGTSPVCELLDWIGHEPPSRKEVEELKVRPKEWPPDQLTDQFSIVRTSPEELPIDRVIRLGFKTAPSAQRVAQAMFSWKNLDRSLAGCYGSLVRGAV